MKNVVVSLLAKFRALFVFRRRLFVVVAILVGLIVFARISPPPRPRQALNKIAYENAAAQSSELQMEAGRTREELIDHGKISVPPLDFSNIPGSRLGGTMAPGDPLIAHTAELAVATNEFAKARSSLEEILDHHRGYVAKLRMVGKPTGSSLSATLRIPPSEYGPALTDLKTLGRVEREEEAVDEITQQRADLEARLSNAQNTLHHLQELLKQQTYPDRNVMELQRQIASVSADINRLEADRSAAEHRVVFANVLFALREEIAQPTESLGSQFRSAAVAGFTEALRSLSALIMLLISRGPVFLLWIAILYLPARFAWRHWRHSARQGEASVEAA